MLDNMVRTDPPVSEAQRRAMFAAKAGNSNIGIPQSVGEEFAEADPGGKLPEHKSDSPLDERLDACQAAMDDCADRMDDLRQRVDAMCARDDGDLHIIHKGDKRRDDAWSEEARKAAAEARRKGSSGGGSEKPSRSETADIVRKIKQEMVNKGIARPEIATSHLDPKLQKIVIHGIVHGTNTLGFREMTKE